ncbi:MAG TPA: sulfatase-like hydrolase/transferase [Pseudomonadales bacterium]|nr:sulfatase-like hydrolase/transferase [Pseudomonadales bacterium]
MKRNILLITTDQMRFDAIGCNGGQVARTPIIDSLARQGINYTRAHNQNVVCMPARATIITGQHVATHGVWMNGVALPEDTPTIAHHLHEHGYRTALLGKAHFEPWLGDPGVFFENRMASEGNNGPHRGFERMELANHFLEGHSHYDRWIEANHKDLKPDFYPMVTNRGQNTASRGETGALQVWPTNIPKEVYHTDWVADRTINWFRELDGTEPFFCWMSFPDPHHPWDPPASECSRVNWRDVPLPSLYSADKADNERLLADKPKHWYAYYDASLWTNVEAPLDFIPRDLTADQVREINAMNHIENELIDEAIGRVLGWLREHGRLDNTDVFFTADHGELQGDFGLMFKGPYHVDALMRLPFIWQPASSANVSPDHVTLPVGHLDLAATFCEIAGIETPTWVEGKPLPVSNQQAEQTGRENVLTEWDSEHGPIDIHIKSIYNKAGWLATTYEKGHLYGGSEGELYNMNDDPEQRVNRWDDKSCRGLRDDLIRTLYDELPPAREPRLDRKAPV